MLHDPPSRLKLAASAVFFFGYLLFQAAYPTVAWFQGGDLPFTWRMFAGHGDSPQFIVVNADGSQRAAGNALRATSGARVLGSEVDQRRVLPPWLCRHWSGAESVIVRDRLTGEESVIACRSIAP